MNIIKHKKIYLIIPCVIIVFGLFYMFYNKSQGKGFFNYDIQFTGGTSIEINLNDKDLNNEQILEVFKNKASIDSPQIQRIGNGESVIIKTKSLDPSVRLSIVEEFSNTYGIDKNSFSIEDVSATISNEMKRSALLAISISCLAMLLYVSIRFKDFKIGASTIIALLNDALIVIVFYGIFRIPLNNSFIAALLTVLGYSINSTIVIFDRVRENKLKNPRILNDELINKSVSQTIKRSIFTSLTTFFTIASLYFLGVQAVKIFALPIIVGIVCGTYSSIFISGSMWYILSKPKAMKDGHV